MFSPAAGLKNRDGFLKTMILLREQGHGGAVAFELMELVALPLLVFFHPRPNWASVDRAGGYTKAPGSRANICPQ